MNGDSSNGEVTRDTQKSHRYSTVHRLGYDRDGDTYISTAVHIENRWRYCTLKGNVCMK